MIALISCFSMTVHAQKGRIISGNVSDDVAPLIGVGIMIQGTNTGVITDSDGNYTIQNVKPTDVLVFSYIGYATEEIEVGKSATINVVMKADARTIDDAVVVAVGYGDVRRRDLTGSRRAGYISGRWSWRQLQHRDPWCRFPHRKYSSSLRC